MNFIYKIIEWFKNLFKSQDLYDTDVFDEVEDELIPDNSDRKASKFAVLIGINKYTPELNADLNGCVNDVEAMYDILLNTYEFPADNIRVLTDFRATGDNIYDRIDWLLGHKVPGDELVLHYSGHGSQVRDRNGDELEDGMDEILCPSDLDWDNPFTDDTLYELFMEKGEDVNLTFICDACHSATMARELIKPPEDKNQLTETALEPNSKFIKPPVDIRLRSLTKDKLEVRKMGKAISKQNHVLLSGCRDDQTSADAYIDGRWQGALTSSLISAIKTNPLRDWTTIHADIISILNKNGYSQKPQLSGIDNLVRGRRIFGS